MTKSASKPKVKYIEDPRQFLLDNGLLFEINRQILHQYGLAMEVGKGSNFALSVKLWDCRDEAEGVTYGEGVLPLGKAKLEKFLQEQGNDILERRQHALGFTIQD
jgi:hypothetical protein